MKIFIINGFPCSGKTTFEKMAQNAAAAQNKNVIILSTIDYVKSIAQSLGWNGAKSNKDRKFLSDLKDALTQWNDSPYTTIANTISQLKEKGNIDIVFIDCREPKEIQRFVDDYNAKTVFIQREEKVSVGNHADDNVLNYQYDIIINNNSGLNELKEKAKNFLEVN